MTIQFTGASENRKEFVKAMGEVLGLKPEYKGPPGFAYTVGNFTILRNGDVEADDFIDPKALGQLLMGLRAKGFNQIGNEFALPEEAPDEVEIKVATTAIELDGVTLSFPKEAMDAQAISNLRKLVEGKAWLIKLALKTDALPIEETDEWINFPWLKGDATPELIDAATWLITAMIKLAKKQQRVTLTAQKTDNPRYAFRCFLLRLGFIGGEYKDVRRLLMRDIPGNGSIRHIETPEEVAAMEADRPEPQPCEVRKLEEYEYHDDDDGVSADIVDGAPYTDDIDEDTDANDNAE